MRNPSRRLVLTIIAFAWSTLFLPFAAPLADALEVKRVPNLQVFDANNKLLGKVASFSGDDDVQVVFEVNKSIFFVRVLRNGFTSEETLYYTSLDCAGSPWDDVDNGSGILLEGIIGPPGNTVYLKDLSAVPQEITIRSEFTEDEDDDTSVRLCRNVTPYTEDKIPTIPIIDLSTVFTPPFSVR